MYNWKEIALMYKEEANRLCDECHDIYVHITDRVPGGMLKAEQDLKKSCIYSDKQLKFIESFENNLDITKIEPIVNQPITTQSLKTIQAEVHNFKYGNFFSGNNCLKEGDYKLAEEMCSHINDPKKNIYEIMDKCALICALKILKEKRYTILNENIEKNKNNVFTILDNNSKTEKTVKVLVSGMEFSGKTRKFGNDGEFYQVERQHTYLIDPNESIKDRYFFMIFNSRTKTTQPYAWVKGKYLHEMLVEPIVERFVGKKACILQTKSYSSNDSCSYSIKELILRRDQ